MGWKSFREKLNNWELWPFNLRYLFISPIWLLYCLRARSLWFFSSSNPTLTFGGFEGEGKKEMYELLPLSYYPKTIYVEPAASFDTVKQLLTEHQFHFPFVVKPDVGMKGLLFRKIDHLKELETYHKLNPFVYIIQELVNYPLEVSVFYYRFPYENKGKITGFIQKELMDVIGDGIHTLLELIMEHPNARHRPEEMKTKHAHFLDEVIPKGERFVLTYAANLNRGAKFTNLHKQIDDQLVTLFDEISHRAKFYYGRYDIKCASIEDLKQGKNFSILEFNGSGAEPNHVYQSGFSLFDAYKVFLFHWKVLYKISRYNHKNGIPYWDTMRGLRFLKEAKKHLRLLEKYDNEIPV
jgi:hypothetical protein